MGSLLKVIVACTPAPTHRDHLFFGVGHLRTAPVAMRSAPAAHVCLWCCAQISVHSPYAIICATPHESHVQLFALP